jgi:hypothetical protein
MNKLILFVLTLMLMCIDALTSKEHFQRIAEESKKLLQHVKKLKLELVEKQTQLLKTKAPIKYHCEKKSLDYAKTCADLAEKITLLEPFFKDNIEDLGDAERVYDSLIRIAESAEGNSKKAENLLLFTKEHHQPQLSREETLIDIPQNYWGYFSERMLHRSKQVKEYEGSKDNGCHYQNGKKTCSR